MKLFKLLLVLLFSSVLLVACGGDKENTDSGGQSLEGARDQNIQPTATDLPTEVADGEVDGSNDDPTPTPEITNPWGLEDILVYTTNRTLYVWDFELHEEPQAIAYDVDEANITYVPTKQGLLFGAWDNSNFWINLLSLETYEVQPLVDLGRSSAPGREVNWYTQSWSPDSNWFILSSWDFNLPMGIAAADGSGYLIRIEDNMFNSIWTRDNELVLAIVDYGSFSDTPSIPEIQEIIKIDPDTDGREDISAQIDIDHINSAVDYSEQYEFFYQELDDSGFELTYSLLSSADEDEEGEDFYFIQVPEGLYENFNRNDTPVYCREWQILKWNTGWGSPYAEDTDFARAEILYYDDATALLTRLETLTDDSMLFLRISYPDCTYGTPLGELIHLTPEGEQHILSDKLAHAGDSSAFQGGLIRNHARFVVEPNGTHVLWLESDGIGLSNILYLTDLTNFESEAFKIDNQLFEGIVSLFWFDKEMIETPIDKESDVIIFGG